MPVNFRSLAFLLVKKCISLILAGVCLGLQCAVIEFARNALGWHGAHSTEANPTTEHPVVGKILSPVRSTYGGYYGLVVVTPPPRPQTFHRSHNNVKNPYRIASIFYM